MKNGKSRYADGERANVLKLLEALPVISTDPPLYPPLEEFLVIPTTECKTLVPLDRKRLEILIPMYVKAVHFEFEIEFPRGFLHMGRRGPTDGRRRRTTKAPETTK